MAAFNRSAIFFTFSKIALCTPRVISQAKKYCFQPFVVGIKEELPAQEI